VVGMSVEIQFVVQPSGDRIRPLDVLEIVDANRGMPLCLSARIAAERWGLSQQDANQIVSLAWQQAKANG